MRADLILDRVDVPVEAGDEAEVDADQPGVVVPGHHALQGGPDPVAAALDGVVGERGQDGGVALPVGDGLQDAPGGLVPGHGPDRGRQADQGPFVR